MIPSGLIDLHMHTTVSDGTDSPEQLPEKLKAAGITLFSVTDHDAVKAVKILRKILKKDDPVFIPGVEFSCKDENGKYHILGYGYDPDSPDLNALVARTHQLRMEKVLARLDFLKTEFGFAFPQEELDRLCAMDNPGKPHIGNLMVKYGFAKTKEEAILDYIDKLRIRNKYIRPEEAIAAILAGGGVPVLAHPFYGSGNELILGDEMDGRLRRLMEYGLQGVEAFYSGFTDKLRASMLAFAKRYHLYVTAGSDYHGTNKLVKLGDTGLDTTAEYPEGLTRFLKTVVK